MYNRHRKRSVFRLPPNFYAGSKKKRGCFILFLGILYKIQNWTKIIVKYRLQANNWKIEPKGMTFDHDFGYSFPLFSFLLKKGEDEMENEKQKLWSKVCLSARSIEIPTNNNTNIWSLESYLTVGLSSFIKNVSSSTSHKKTLPFCPHLITWF